MSIRKSILYRTRVAFFLISAFGAVILGKIGYLQFIQGDKWRERAKENGLSYRIIKANRGNILADDGSLLASSTPFYRLAIDPTIASEEVFEKGVDSLAILLAKYFNEKTPSQHSSELRNFRKQNKKYKILAQRLIDYQEKKLLSNFPILREGRKEGGLILESQEKRFKPFDPLLRRTIGFTQETDTQSVTGVGLEYSFQKILAGSDGQALFQRMAGNQWKPVNDGSQIHPEHGLDIQTTIDIDIQEVAHETLKRALISNDADFGCVILMEVETGAVKAIVNLGKTEGDYTENNNFAVGSAGLAEPGSTFKMMTMTALLEEAELKLSDSIDAGNGRFQFFENAVMTDSYSYGRITVKSAFEKSSNIGVSKLAYQYFKRQPEKFLKYLENFGLTKPISFQLQGEATPFIKTLSDKTWSGATLPWMSVGYELLLTPLHTLTFCNALANHGRMMQPYLVKKTLYANTVIEEFEPKSINEKICSAKTLAAMRILMEGVVENGTANVIKSNDYKIAGKTGTSEKVENRQYTEKNYTSFVGYFPSDAPKYSAIVVISNSVAGKYGGKIAAPVFKEISDYVFRRYLSKPMTLEEKSKLTLPSIKSGFQKDMKLLSEQFGFKNQSFTAENWTLASVRGDTVKWTANAMQKETVPLVEGMTLKDAIYLLENKGLEVRYFGSGKVFHQSLPAGSKLAKGGKVVLSLR